MEIIANNAHILASGGKNRPSVGHMFDNVYSNHDKF